MKKEYDFSKGKRGHFYNLNGKLNVPNQETANVTQEARQSINIMGFSEEVLLEIHNPLKLFSPLERDYSSLRASSKQPTPSKLYNFQK